MIGDRVNVAARLQSAAEVGGVLMDRATYEYAQCTMTAAPASITLKGKAEPERVYAIATEDILALPIE